MTEIRIQSGIPLPPIRRVARKPRKYPLEKLAVGEMYFAPGKSSKQLSCYVSRRAKYGLLGEFTTRHCWMYQDRSGDWHPCDKTAPGAVAGAGVWRVR